MPGFGQETRVGDGESRVAGQVLRQGQILLIDSRTVPTEARQDELADGSIVDAERHDQQAVDAGDCAALDALLKLRERSSGGRCC